MKGNQNPVAHSWGEPDWEGDEDNGMFGFTGSDMEELMCQGVKPWDDDAWVCFDLFFSTRVELFRCKDVLGVLRGY